jgi:hypothetical protein
VSPEPEVRAPRRSNRPTLRARWRRAAVCGIAAVAVTATAACQPVEPVGVPYQTPADAAAGWLVADHAANGSSYGAGFRADLVIALAATAGDRAVAETALAELEAVTPAFVQPGGVVNPGATGKTLLAVQAMRFDGRDFAGLDLDALLRSTLVTEGANTGRFGTSSLWNQALATLGLARTPGRSPAPAGAWIAARQCPSGAFSWGDCAYADADHTAMAVQAMAAAGGQQAAVDAGVQWLLDQQNADGGWGDGGSNANSTGLAAQTVRMAGHGAEADAAADWVVSVQKTEAPNIGAVPWTDGTDGSLLLSTAQAVLAFGNGPLHRVAFAQVVGAPCPDADSGVTVIVDLARYDGTIKVGCAAGAPANGWVALEAAGFEVGSVPGTGDSAICTIDDAPTTGYPDCWNTGFWAYFHDEARSGAWTSSMEGALGRTPPQGSVDGWRYEPDWSTHWASEPGIDPLWRQLCTAVELPAAGPVAQDDTLTVSGPNGAPAEVAVLDGSDPLTVEDVLGATWNETSSVSMAGHTGPTRVLARSASPSCNPAEPAELTAAVYDVQPAGVAGSDS